ncbi:MAG TPA: polymer-forming cytoskeletal protein [Gemmatimonadaceae bacterium]|nr:polymer-forming cytoskeletal protein [Gemmatimonadaceae bacterium]
MRTAILPLILAVAAAPLTARQAAGIQQNPNAEKPTAESSAKAATPAGAVEAADSANVQLPKATLDSLTELVNRFRRDPEAVPLPPNTQIAMGGRTIPAGTSVAGPVAAAGGPLHVYGTVTGDAIAIGGDVIVHPGARITGNAVSALGTVTLAGGTVGGEIRQLAGALGAVQQAAEVESPARSTRHALALSSSWLIILVLMAIGVLLFAGDYLDGVVDSLEGRFGRSFWAGIATQLALAPVLCLLVIALAVTILGILLIPFAIVAFVLAVAGLITLGFLAIARVTGESVAPAASKRYSARGAALRALVVGVSIYMGLWVLASAFAWAPIVETVLRAVAIAITWVATTAGLGAAVISRGGTKRSAPTPSLAAVNDIPWQTPTPVTGVVAARRPTPASPARDR